MMTRGHSISRSTRTACLACRRSKRRCGRETPTCELCMRKGIECSYPPLNRPETRQNSQPTPSPLAISAPELQPIRVLCQEQPEAALIYFLAPEIFQQAGLSLPTLQLTMTPELADQIVDETRVRTIASRFFATIHRWLPIVSRTSFYTTLMNPLASRQAELSLLVLSMKLCCSTPPSACEQEAGSNLGLYQSTRRLYQEAEVSGPLSVHVLQAGLLIALYELGQSFYPAAYMTVGMCVRYGLAMKADRVCSSSGEDDHEPCSWNNTEQIRRAWWAVLIFDRFLGLCDPSRPLSTKDPSFHYYLPVDDIAWNEGDSKSNDSTTISQGFSAKIGSYARLAQATYLLSQGLRIISSENKDDDAVQLEQIAQLRKTLLSLVHAADAEVTVRRLEFCAQSEASLTMILLLQEYYLRKYNHDGIKESFWEETHVAINRLVTASEAYNRDCPSIAEASDSVPIFLIVAVYQAANMLLSLRPENKIKDAHQSLQSLQDLLGLIDRRWKLAGTYLKLLQVKSAVRMPEKDYPFMNLFPVGYHLGSQAS